MGGAGSAGAKPPNVMNQQGVTEVRFKSLRRPLLGGLMGGGCLKVGRAG